MKVIFLKSRWLFKYLIFVPVIVIVVLNIQFIYHIREHNNLHSTYNSRHPIEIYREIEKIKQEISIVHLRQKNASKKFRLAGNLSNLDNLKKIIDEKNMNPIISNKHFIEDLLVNEKNVNKNKKIDDSKNYQNQNDPNTKKFHYKSPIFFVILVQVHSRLNYLKELIESLKETKYIEQTLVIFSHDLYDPKMNELIGSIDFCAVNNSFYFATISSLARCNSCQLN